MKLTKSVALAETESIPTSKMFRRRRLSSTSFFYVECMFKSAALAKAGSARHAVVKVTATQLSHLSGLCLEEINIFALESFRSVVQ